MGNIFYFDWEIALLDLIRTHLACAWMDVLVPLFTSLGNAGIIWITAALAMCCTKKYRANGIIMLLALLTGLLIGNFIIKPLIARARPCWIMNVPLLIASPDDFSFPSGHTLSSVIGAVCLTCANRRFGAIAIPIAAMMAFTRLYLYVHFPTDILAGIVLGVAIGLLMQLLIPVCNRLLEAFYRRIRRA